MDCDKLDKCNNYLIYWYKYALSGNRTKLFRLAAEILPLNY